MKRLLKNFLVTVVMFTTIESYSHIYTILANDQTKNITAISIDSVNEGSIFFIKDSFGIVLYKEEIVKAPLNLYLRGPLVNQLLRR